MELSHSLVERIRQVEAGEIDSRVFETLRPEAFEEVHTPRYDHEKRQMYKKLGVI